MREGDGSQRASRIGTEENVSIDLVTRREQRQIRASEKREVFDLLKDVGLALTSMLGRCCEVVIHDTGDLEHSIVWIEGDVTGRKIGGMLSDMGLEALRKGETHPVFNYTTYTETGKTLKSCSIWLRDHSGQVYGAFCINLDVSVVEQIQDFVRDLAPDTSRLDLGEDHAQSLHDLLDTMIAECEYRIGAPAEEMTKDERIAMVRILDERGAFQVRNSVAYVAGRAGVTRKTIYNDLREIAGEKGDTKAP
jgi:predicted transcriptional regulator YheO